MLYHFVESAVFSASMRYPQELHRLLALLAEVRVLLVRHLAHL